MLWHNVGAGVFKIPAGKPKTKLILSMEKVMVAVVISELDSISRLKFFLEPAAGAVCSVF